MATSTTPDFTDVIDQRFFIEPLGGPSHPQNYLDRFPEEVYNKTIDSHLVRFMYSLLGPSGIGWLQKNYFEARLLLEEYGIETFDLDTFYGNPLRFPRILEEHYDEDPKGLLPREKWEEIRAKDAAYRARALDYVRGMRLGNTPGGIALVARSGLGHEVEIVEHYKWIYDQHTDDPLGLQRFGKTDTTSEFVVLPRRELAQSEVQRITITGVVTGGTFRLDYNGAETEEIEYDNADRETVRAFIESVVGVGNVQTRGGPLPANALDVIFQNELADSDVPQLRIYSSLTGEGVGASVETIKGGIEASQEQAFITPRNQRHLQEALDHLRPQNSVVTYKENSGGSERILWNEITATSSYLEVVRYVTGKADVPWPSPRNAVYWIEPGIEHEGQRVKNDLQFHYAGFHSVGTITAYTEAALTGGHYNNFIDLYNLEPKDEHIGSFDRYQATLYQPLNIAIADGRALSADRVLADYPEPVTVTTQTAEVYNTQLVNGIYPFEYQLLANVAGERYTGDQFWSSKDRIEGDDYLEIDLGTVRAVNYITFEITRKPFNFEIAYDLLDMYPERNFVNVTPALDRVGSYAVGYSPGFVNPWEVVSLNFTDAIGHTIFTRFIRLKFTRRNEDRNSPFVGVDGTIRPHSVDVRNLRLGRSV